MSGFNWFSKSFSAPSESNGIRELFPLSLSSSKFINSDILQTYIKILTDTAERTHGLSDEQEARLWDSCVQTNTNDGLITLLAQAMTYCQDLFLVYLPSVKVLRVATPTEAEQIKKDYAERGESKLGVFVSFRKYRRTEMLKIYSDFEYCVLASLNKTLNVAKSVQFKIADLRQSTSLNDSDIPKAQAKSIAEAMRRGDDVLLDAKDTVATATPDTSPAEKAITFLDSKRAFILGMPLSYVAGEQTAGIGSTGEADMRAVERGLKQYFVSIIRPVFQAVFKIEVSFKSQDFRQMTTGLETLKAFELTSDEYLSKGTKQSIVARVFDIDPVAEAKAIEKEAQAQPSGNGVAPQVAPSPQAGE